MITQIYSIQTAEEALACIEAGADRIGLLVGVHGGKFPCAITQDKAKEIFDAIEGKAVRVLISVEYTADAALAQTKALMPILREAQSLQHAFARRSPACC